MQQGRFVRKLLDEQIPAVGPQSTVALIASGGLLIDIHGLPSRRPATRPGAAHSPRPARQSTVRRADGPFCGDGMPLRRARSRQAALLAHHILSGVTEGLRPRSPGCRQSERHR